MESTPIQADFVDVKSVKTRSMIQLIFEIPIEEADNVMKALKGWPQPGTNRVCAIVLMDVE